MSARSRAKLQALIDCYKQINTDPKCCIQHKGCEKYGAEEKDAKSVKETTDDPHALFNRSPTPFSMGIDLDTIGQDSPDDTDEETDTDWDDDDLIKGVETDQDEDSDAELDDGRENTHNKDTETDDDDDEDYKELQRAQVQKKKEQKFRLKAAEEAAEEEAAEAEGEKASKNAAPAMLMVKRDVDVEEEIIRSLLSSADPSAQSTLLTTTVTAEALVDSATSTVFVTASSSSLATGNGNSVIRGPFNAAATQTLASKHFKEDFDGAKEFFKSTGIGLAVGAVMIFVSGGLLVGGFALYKRKFGSGGGKL